MGILALGSRSGRARQSAGDEAALVFSMIDTEHSVSASRRCGNQATDMRIDDGKHSRMSDFTALRSVRGR